MVEWKISANLLSLGAIDFGIIVDGAVVMIENIVRRLSARAQELGRPLERAERHAEARAAATEMARPTLTGVGIIMIVYLPILTLTGIEGKMFRPMAEVVLLALAGSLIMTFTFVPAAAALLLGGRPAARESPPIRFAHHRYPPRCGGRCGGGARCWRGRSCSSRCAVWSRPASAPSSSRRSTSRTCS